MNLSQSTNDVYPTAVKVAVILAVRSLLEAMEMLEASFARKADEFHAADLRDLLDRELATKPTLPPAPGADDSHTYQAAKRMSETAFEPFMALRAQLDTVAKAEVFVKSADAELQKATVTLLGSSLVWDTKPLRKRTLPELRQELGRFRQLEVPPGGEPAARVVDGTLSASVDEVETMSHADPQHRARGRDSSKVPMLSTKVANDR